MVMRPPFLLTPRGFWPRILSPPASCVLYLPFYPYNLSPTPDYSGYGNDGTISGATWATLTTSPLSYLDFDGDNDFVDCGRDSSLDIGTSDFSIVTWINCHSKVGYRQIMSKGDATKRFYFYVVQTTGVLTAEIDDDLIGGAIIAGATDVATSAWLLAGLSADRDGSGQLYINGVADGSPVGIVGASGSITSAAKDLCIGVQSSDETSYNFDGGMAMPRLLIGKALSTAEHLAFFNTERSYFGV